jgi:hypothetical protein
MARYGCWCFASVPRTDHLTGWRAAHSGLPDEHFALRFFIAAAMPKELRKRGKRHKKSSTEHEHPAQKQDLLDEGPSSRPSWIVPRSDPQQQQQQPNPEAPFGYVDAELKAYFRTVDDQLKEWQQSWDDTERDGETDPNESASMSFLLLLAGLVSLTVCALPSMRRQKDVLDGRSARNLRQGARTRD